MPLMAVRYRYVKGTVLHTTLYLLIFPQKKTQCTEVQGRLKLASSKRPGVPTNKPLREELFVCLRSSVIHVVRTARCLHCTTSARGAALGAHDTFP